MAFDDETFTVGELGDAFSACNLRDSEFERVIIYMQGRRLRDAKFPRPKIVVDDHLPAGVAVFKNEHGRVDLVNIEAVRNGMAHIDAQPVRSNFSVTATIPAIDDDPNWLTLRDVPAGGALLDPAYPWHQCG